MVQAPSAAPLAVELEENSKSTPLQTSVQTEWVVAIKQKLKQVPLDDRAGAWAKTSIYRIPRWLRRSDEKAYTPQTVSLGPYHHGEQQLLGMEQHKWRALHQVLKRTGHRVEVYLAAVKKIEEDARDCYEGPMDLGSEAFVEMLVLDSCFILELLRGVHQGFESLGYSPSDPIFTLSFAKRVTVPSIQRDMMMLENQIPLFVLDRIHYIQSHGTSGSDSPRVARLALNFVKPLLPMDKVPPSVLEYQDRPHCLEVFRCGLLAVGEGAEADPVACVDQEKMAKRGWPMIHCVTELKEAGVKFKVKKTDRFWDIDFNSGILNIPRLPVHAGIKYLFLNLIAFEQCHLDCTNGNGIRAYVTFMDRLIQSPADVAHLRHQGIVDSCLGSNIEVADLFNCLCREVEFAHDDSCLINRWLFGLSEKINEYYNQLEWVVAINHKLKQTRLDDGTHKWAKLSIYRIPECLRNDDKKSYMPQTVSLGPYHHGKGWLSGMEEHKWRALHQVLKRTGHSIELYIKEAKSMEKDARACYEGPINLSSDAFIEMLLLDSCFILELFRGADRGFHSLEYSLSDPIFTTSFASRITVPSIQRDMIMLENQIPFFVLDQIHRISDDTSVARLALMFFEPLLLTDKVLPSMLNSLKDQEWLHCLEVFRWSLLAEQQRPHAGPVEAERRKPMIQCVMKLKEAGVKFEVKETDNFWDIDFNSCSGILNIPRLPVRHGTKSLFLNLIAFEQYHLDCTKGITSYVTFMDSLIESSADVAYLRQCGILGSCLGSDIEVADLFNSLCHEVEFVLDDSWRLDSWLFGLADELNMYYTYPWHEWRASLAHNYFSNPWSIISFIAATILVFLTLAQTFYAVYAYHFPSS